MVKLVIVESPAKCQKIQGFLGTGWRVIATMGHIRALKPELDAIGLTNDFEPKYEFLKEKAKAVKQLKEAAASATEIYLASDDDREGEAISYAVCILLKLNPKTTPRAVFHEITEKAIKAAVATPRLLDMNRVNAQQSRAILDMMIGFTMSPLLWRYVAPSLSAGRCQTPAIRLVVEREDQITEFKASSSWALSGTWEHPSSSFNFHATMEDELEDEESAINYMENIYQTPNGIVISKDIRPWQERPPEPLITSTLQQQASAIYNINPKNTMKIAQRLYEAGHITYMRTDHAVMSEEAKDAARKWVTENYGAEFVAAPEDLKAAAEGLKKRATKKPSAKAAGGAGTTADSSSVLGTFPKSAAQEAHEAIRPTHMELAALEGADWTHYDRKVYALIWQRAIQSVMSPARGETCKVRAQISDECDDAEFTWISQWRRTTFEGWKCAGKVANIDDDSASDSGEKTATTADKEWLKATAMEQGDKVCWKSIKAEPKETRAQGRYTEATLVRELEKHGIGRPSTFASLLSTIQDKNYVETKDIPARETIVKEYTLAPNTWPPAQKDLKKKVGAEKNKLVPTDLGRSVLSFMLSHFEDIFNYNFTAKMEKRLDAIADGEEPWKQVLRDMWESYKERYETLLSKQSLKPKEGETSAKVKEFSDGLKAVQTKKGPLLLIEGDPVKFLGWPTGVAFDKMTEEIALKFKETAETARTGEQVGEWKGSPILKKKGKFGEYLQSGETSIPFKHGEPLDKIIERLEAKTSGSTGTLKEFKEYSIRTGQYGPYIMKTSLKKPQFVSLPKDVDPNTLTQKEVEAIFKLGLETKKKWVKNKKPAGGAGKD
jgi:DNA topoisomerase-1